MSAFVSVASGDAPVPSSNSNSTPADSSSLITEAHTEQDGAGQTEADTAITPVTHTTTNGGSLQSPLAVTTDLSNSGLLLPPERQSSDPMSSPMLPHHDSSSSVFSPPVHIVPQNGVLATLPSPSPDSFPSPVATQASAADVLETADITTESSNGASEATVSTSSAPNSHPSTPKRASLQLGPLVSQSSPLTTSPAMASPGVSASSTTTMAATATATPTPSYPPRRPSFSSSGGIIDVPLSYSSQYSPSASSRRLATSTGNASLSLTRTRSRENSRSNSPLVVLESAIAATTAPSTSPQLTASPSTPAPAASATPTNSSNSSRGGFLSNFFGWGSSKATVSSSTPTTPTPAPVVPPTRSSSAQSVQPNASSASTTGAAAIPSALPPSHPLPSSATNSSSLTTSSSVPTGLDNLRRDQSSTTAHRITMQPVGSHSHPLFVAPVIPLTPAQRAALVSYSQRLRSALATHEDQIARLQTMKKKYQLSRNEETSIWNRFAISSLVSIAASLYHTHLLHCSALLQLEFSYSAEISNHLNQIQTVLENRQSVALILSQIAAAKEQYIKEAEAAVTHAENVAAKHNSKKKAREAAQIEEEQRDIEVKKQDLEERRLRFGEAASSVAAGPASATARTDELPFEPTPCADPFEFLSASEIELLFWPHECVLIREQVAALQETAEKLERTYRDMQRKALSQSDSKQSRLFALHTLLVKEGLDSSARDLELRHEFFFVKQDSNSLVQNQITFDTLLLDLRVEEGKIVKRWIDMMQQSYREIVTATASALPSNPSATNTAIQKKITPLLVANFVEFVVNDVNKRYELHILEKEREKEREKEMQHKEAQRLHRLQSAQSSGTNGEDEANEEQQEETHYTINDSLTLYLQRLLFPRLYPILSCFYTEHEQDLDQWYLKKLSWIRKLTRAQLGLNPHFLPLGCDMNASHAFEWTDSNNNNSSSSSTNSSSTTSTSENTTIGFTAGGPGPTPSPDEADYDISSANAANNLEQPSTKTSPSSIFAKSRAASSPRLPFQSAMNMLHRFCRVASTKAPIDTLYVLIQTVREITRLAKLHLEQHQQKQKEQEAAAAAAAASFDDHDEEFSPFHSSKPPTSNTTSASKEHLSADNMFPLVLYVVIHSGLNCPHYAFGMLTKFLPSRLLQFGISGYSFILIESAVSHVNDMARSDVQQVTTTSSTFDHPPPSVAEQVANNASVIKNAVDSALVGSPQRRKLTRQSSSETPTSVPAASPSADQMPLPLPLPEAALSTSALSTSAINLNESIPPTLPSSPDATPASDANFMSPAAPDSPPFSPPPKQPSEEDSDSLTKSNHDASFASPQPALPPPDLMSPEKEEGPVRATVSTVESEINSDNSREVDEEAEEQNAVTNVDIEDALQL